MRTIDVVQSQSERNQCLRLLMLLIIVGTFPFYGIAIFIIGSAPVDIAAVKDDADCNAGAELHATGRRPSKRAHFHAAGSPARHQYATAALPATPGPVCAADAAAGADYRGADGGKPVAHSDCGIGNARRATATASIADADLDGLPDEQDRCPQEAGVGRK